VEWTQPINGWDFVASSLVGIVTTVISVWIGVRVALTQERRQDEKARLRDERERGLEIARRWESPFGDVIIPLWFRLADEQPGEVSKWDDWIGVKWRLYKALSERFGGMPESQRDVERWLRIQLDDFAERADRTYQAATNDVVREQTNEFLQKVGDAIMAYARGNVTVEWFSNELALHDATTTTENH